MRRSVERACVVLLLLAAAGAAQAAPKKKGPAPAKDPGAVVQAPRASWLSDRVPLRVGDLLTVVVDEQTAARSRVSRTASGKRTLGTDLTANVASGSASAQNTAVKLNSGLGNDSRDAGESSRSGDLSAVLTVRITEVEPSGLAHVSGSRKVVVDGQTQEIALEGVVRPEDISASNRVASNAIADAVITYKGKKIGPRVGIMGRLLGMMWP
jgi:flagellar L-ring protein FlgH